MWIFWIIFPAIGALALSFWMLSAPHSDARRLRRIERLYALCRRLLPATPEISVDELLDRRQQARWTIVDVRTEQERAVSMIPGAISREEFESRREEFRGAPVVAYCTLGYRSGKYAAQLRREGFEAWNLRGAILAWTHAKAPLVDANGETRRVHVYGRAWNLAASGYEGVW